MSTTMFEKYKVSSDNGLFELTLPLKKDSDGNTQKLIQEMQILKDKVPAIKEVKIRVVEEPKPTLYIAASLDPKSTGMISINLKALKIQKFNSFVGADTSDFPTLSYKANLEAEISKPALVAALKSATSKEKIPLIVKMFMSLIQFSMNVKIESMEDLLEIDEFKEALKKNKSLEELFVNGNPELLKGDFETQLLKQNQDLREVYYLATKVVDTVEKISFIFKNESLHFDIQIPQLVDYLPTEKPS